MARARTSPRLNQFTRTKIRTFKEVLQTLHLARENYLHNNLNNERFNNT